MKEVFHKFAARVSTLTGAAGAFVLALTIIIVWAITGPLFKFSDTWQLVINTSTTIVTFLMVFLIQNTQNRDSKAVHLKLDELIRVSVKARDSFVELEDMSDEDLNSLDVEFHELHDKNLASPLLHKLHKKISAEHKRRLTVKDIFHKS
ncbi:MAG: low affinity iron permease family protein [Candidatus Saccharimonadales bacterium]